MKRQCHLMIWVAEVRTWSCESVKFDLEQEITSQVI